MRLPFFCFGRLGQPVADVVLEVGGDALEAADRDRLFLDAAAPAGGLARAVAGAAEHARKHVRFPIDHVGVGVAARRDQPDVFGHRRVRRTGPLAIHHLVEIIRGRNVGRFHSHSSCAQHPPYAPAVLNAAARIGIPRGLAPSPNSGRGYSRAKCGFPPLLLVITRFCRLVVNKSAIAVRTARRIQRPRDPRFANLNH